MSPRVGNKPKNLTCSLFCQQPEWMDGRHRRYVFTHTEMSTFKANSIKRNILLSMTGQRQEYAHTQQALPLRQKHWAQMVEASDPGLNSDTFGRFNYSTFGAANLLMFPNSALLQDTEVVWCSFRT